MRIAYLSADHGIPVTGDKGAAVHIQEVTRAMAELGHEVEVFAARVGGRPERMAAPVHKLRAAIPIAGVAAEDLESDTRLAKERRNLAIADHAVRAIVERHNEKPFDLVYERYSLFSDASARLRGDLGLPVILEVNAPLLEEQRQYRKLAMEPEAADVMRRAFGSANKLVAVSREVANYAIANGADSDRVAVIPNGIDPARFRPDGPTLPVGGSGSLPIVGFAGSFKPWHGLELLLPAFREVAARHPTVHLLLVGRGPLEDWIKGFIAGAGLEERVTLTGWLDNDAMPAAIRAMDIATAPYPPMQNFYFSPLKIYEYLACGVPVVARRLGQIAEVVQDGVNGRLIAPDAGSEELAAALLDLCRPDYRQSLAAATTLQSQDWSWQRKIQDILGGLPKKDTQSSQRISACAGL